MASVFANLEDSPMFRKQVFSMELSVDELRSRCEKLYNGSKSFMVSLGEAYYGDLAFAESLEAFGAGKDDPTSIAIGGPVMSKFTTVFRELGSYKELLRSQVEHMLSARLLQFINVDLHAVKDCRQRLEKATLDYDQARERFVSIKKGTKPEIISELEEDLHNSKSAFERCRFNLVNALANIEAKKKYEFLEATGAVVDAHLRYFKQGYELLSQLETFVNQVLCYSLQSREIVSSEQDKLAKRIQEFRTQEEIASSRCLSNLDASTSGDILFHPLGAQSYKKIESLMHPSNGEVQIIKQGYLLKRSSSIRADWKRRFFVLDSHGTLYYYRNKGGQSQQSGGSSEGSGMFGRFRLSNQKTPTKGEDNLGYHTVDLRIATIKIDSEQSNLRFCFRLISPIKTFTLQAENEADRMDWVEKITGAITSLLNSTLSRQISSGSGAGNRSFSSRKNSDSSTTDERYNKVSQTLRGISGNEKCAECGAPDPDWASLNLGILICIECSGAHRNLGVHISKVRSLTLDVKVWDPVVIDLFQNLGNAFCNSVWEESLLQNHNQLTDESDKCISPPAGKPNPNDSFSRKEKYIQSKYVDQSFIIKETNQPSTTLYEAIKSNNIKEVYRLIIKSNISPTTRYDDISNKDPTHIFDTPRSKSRERKQIDPTNCQKIKECFQGCSLLHLACNLGNSTMVELLLQIGADINAHDFHGRTVLHHCVFKKNDELAKYLLRKGARTTIKDGGGLTALERKMEMGAITDDELFLLFVNDSGNCGH